MDKTERKSDIGFLGIAAALAKMCTDKDGVIDIGTWLDRRKAGYEWKPGVFLQPWKFMELFGEDTEYQYFRDRDGDLQVFTQVNGITYFAIIRSYDLIVNGVLV